ncbi:MAG: hypothetical protein WCE51_08590 [Chthoniobacterales bacterium]|jgi:hypothetical protein
MSKQAGEDIDAQGENGGVEGEGDDAVQGAQRRISGELICTSETCEVMPMTKEK